MISWSGIGEIQPANCQMTTADVTATAMIRNNAVWIHGLIKHCLHGWTDKFGHFYACVHEMTGQGPPAPRKHVNNFWRDLFRDAGKTTRLGAMNTERITIPQSKLQKYCHGQLCQVLRMFICGFSSTIALTKAKLDPQCQLGMLGTMPTQSKIFPNLNRKESMQNIDKIILYAISLRTVMILITRLGSNTVICQSQLC